MPMGWCATGGWWSSSRLELVQYPMPWILIVAVIDLDRSVSTNSWFPVPEFWVFHLLSSVHALWWLPIPTYEVQILQLKASLIAVNVREMQLPCCCNQPNFFSNNVIKVSLKNRSYKTIVSHSTKYWYFKDGINAVGICNTEGNGSQLWCAYRSSNKTATAERNLHQYGCFTPSSAQFQQIGKNFTLSGLLFFFVVSWWTRCTLWGTVYSLLERTL